MRKPLKSGEKGVYRCSRYNNNGSRACTTHYIDEADITAFVLNDIRRHAVLAANEREKLANRLMTNKTQAKRGEVSALRAKIREAESRLSVICTTLKSLYVDKATGKLPESVFLSLMNDFTREQATLEERLPSLRRELDGIQETAGEIESWLKLVENYLNLETLDRATVTGLIESIAVSERVKTDGKGKQAQTLEIRYRFIGNLTEGAGALRNENERHGGKDRLNADEGVALAS